MLKGILFATVVILLLVVLVPVGVALVQRVRKGRSATAVRTAPARAPRPAPPPLELPPTTPVPVPPAEKPKRDDATRMIPLPDTAGEPPAGTEMMQWNGMLHCTAGALEGQRFIIEDDGFYIGRDPAFASVVLTDSRISKRHVRILPRDGKVWAIDEGSTNGTFLKKQRITEVALKRGDTLVLGDDAAAFVYEV